MTVISVQMRLNSAEGIFTTHLYSVSGIPKCSLSMSINWRVRRQGNNKEEMSVNWARRSAGFAAAKQYLCAETNLHLEVRVARLLGRLEHELDLVAVVLSLDGAEARKRRATGMSAHRRPPEIGRE
jgi:hypothetical protein